MKALKNIWFLMGILQKKHKGYLGLAAAGLALPCLANLVQVVFPGEILKALEAGDFTEAGIRAAAMCILIFLTGAAVSLAEYGKYSHSGEFGITLHKMLAESVSAWPYERFEEFSSRQKYHFAVMCVKEGTAEAVLGCAVGIGGSLLSLLSLLYVSRMIVWWLWLIMALSVAVNVGCEIYRARYDYKSYEEYSAIDMRMLYARDVLTWKEFAKESRIFSMYRYVTDTAEHYIGILSGLQAKRASRTFIVYLLSCLFDFIQRVGIFGYIAWQTYRGNISIADFSVLTLAMITVSALCIDIAKNLVRLGETGRYIGAYADVMKDSEKIPGRAEAANKTGGPEDGEAADRERLILVFDHVSFVYPGTDTPALEDVSFTFESDKKYGLVGANGSGKTTFINLLTGMFTPVSGRISCNGKNLRDIPAAQWRRLFSAVLQDFNTYAYTAGENVAMFGGSKNPGGGMTAEKALEQAGIGWLKPEEYLTSEYEQGRELSGGEAQKLAIARAIYRDARIFVFDEPTAALSPASERELYENVYREMGDKMIFFISHRLASCRMCDEVLVFEKGRIAESGSHEELIKKDGLYAEMFRAQASLYGK